MRRQLMVQHSRTLWSRQDTAFQRGSSTCSPPTCFCFLILQWADICNCYSWSKAQRPSHTLLLCSASASAQDVHSRGTCNREDLNHSLYSSHNSLWPQFLLGMSFHNSSLHVFAPSSLEALSVLLALLPCVPDRLAALSPAFASCTAPCSELHDPTLFT